MNRLLAIVLRNASGVATRPTFVGLAIAALGAGCASAGGAAQTDAPPVQESADAKVWLDGRIETQPDADTHHDAASDAPPDACVPHATELLTNPVFDLTPLGTGWTQTPIDTSYPPITSDNGSVGQYAPQSAPYKAWLGGFEAPQIGQMVTDFVYQDIAVPAGTTALAITGYYLVDTAESGGTVYDTGALRLLQTNGTPIESVLALTNVTTTSAAWTAFNHTFTANVAGQTVRLQMTSSNDYSNVTNFMFDTLSIKATHCP